MPALKCSVGIQRKSGSGFQPLRRGKMPRPLFGAEPRNLADIVSRAGGDYPLLIWFRNAECRSRWIGTFVIAPKGADNCVTAPIFRRTMA